MTPRATMNMLFLLNLWCSFVASSSTAFVSHKSDPTRKIAYTFEPSTFNYIKNNNNYAYQLQRDSSFLEPLFAKKKSTSNTANNNNASSSKLKKIQVKLLHHVAGTGQAGDVVSVSPSFYRNQLQPKQAAILITNVEVASELAATKAKMAAYTEQALWAREVLQETSLNLKRKAGPQGQLFGAIHYKNILEELQQQQSSDLKDFFKSDNKQIKFLGLKDENDQTIATNDIKHVGKYTATIALSSDIQAKLSINVEAEI